MINLIPNEEKKQMSKDFYLRLATIFFTMLGISFLLAAILTLPSYYVSSAEKNLINDKLEAQKNEPGSLSDQNIIGAAKSLKSKLSLIENAQKSKTLFSEKVINEVMLKKMPNIKITEISYQRDPDAGEKINVSGTATSREVLLLFRRALEDDVAFSKVDLPISNFVKGSDIEFYLSLIPS